MCLLDTRSGRPMLILYNVVDDALHPSSIDPMGTQVVEEILALSFVHTLLRVHTHPRSTGIYAHKATPTLQVVRVVLPI